ncbi:MAG: usg protein [Pseudomonadota bacterium]
MRHGDFADTLAGFSLTTAEILYHLPDHPTLLQTFIWQEFDMHPRFPRLRKFLDFWTESLDGPLHTVRVAHRQLVAPAELRLVEGQFRLN